jgi:KDO2-lipid IV(A) lauroyltransferase
LDITPITKLSLENAFRRLKSGGVVATGIDRPIEFDMRGPLLPFFGRPAPLPTGYIRMALKTGAKIVVAAIQLLKNGSYHINLSEPLEMQHYPDKLEEIMVNGHKVLQIVEHYIRENPDQWLMFNSVWPGNTELVG